MIDRTRPVVVITGAGVSAESGIPTFRGAGGMWGQYRATDLATPQAFKRDPKLVWEFYSWRRELIATCHPNSAHETIALMEDALLDFVLITQNVDGLHQQAGSRNILTLHGDIWHTRCARCRVRESDHRVPLPEIPPKCAHCGGLVRPDVVWFGEPLPQSVLDAALAASARAALMLVVGTSALVHPAATLPLVAQRNGAKLVEVNPDETPISRFADETLRGPAGEILPDWWAGMVTKI